MYTPPTCPVLLAALATLDYAHVDRGTCRVQDVAVLPDGTAFVAVRRTLDWRSFNAGRECVTAIVIAPTSDGVNPWSMTIEQYGPRDDRCPARILDQLSPVGVFAEPVTSRLGGYYESATAWRGRCRQTLNQSGPA